MTRTAWVSLALALVLSSCGDDGGSPDAAARCVADEQCDDGVFCNGTERCDPASETANALGCVAGPRPCEVACLELEDRCDGDCEVPDGDGDGVDRLGCGGSDCDDEDPNRFPGNPEICDEAGVDEDCDPATVGALDRDRDGYSDVRCGDGLDCDDADPAVSPASAEVCNGIDDDCDGDVDEGVAVSGFADADADGRGASDRPLIACPGSARFALVGDDCDDANPAVQPAQAEVCDGIDNDCDGTTDEDAAAVLWYEDGDGDGYGAAFGERRVSCEPIAGFSLLPTDCDDANASVSPVAVETCNGLDDDCSGRADFAVDGDGEDDDGDGVADSRCGGTDCDDARAGVAEGFPERCNGVDDDCDGTVDEGVDATDWYVDGDGDGWGAGPAMRLCVDAPALVARAGDCDDRRAEVHPEAAERCDGVDQDCDARIDEEASAACSLPNARAVCSAGRCEVSECLGTFGDCNLRSVDGCETSLDSMASCGLCGAVCNVPCAGGFCDDNPTEIVVPITVLRTDAATPIAGAGVFLPLTRPLRTFTTDAAGQVDVLLPLPTEVTVTDPTLFPTVYPYDAGTVPPVPGFSRAGAALLPLERAELADQSIAQDPSLGMIVVVDELGGMGPEVEPALGAPFGEAIAVDRAPRLARTGGTALGAGSPMLLFTDVVPGRVQIDVLPCRVDDSVVRVHAGALSVVRVTCAGP